ncbi:hypothetical protein AOQ84DRAFT_356972 [Glonium stellatum]|uniref:Uncharacterized protein n=1 Tax=Glonium stellatum TaxID=574774 RepID=A0A8E2ER03_9PEZI|nr:hypothetical protein AOQ84DRAFT_356972 [Glonium stellatum]
MAEIRLARLVGKKERYRFIMTDNKITLKLETKDDPGYVFDFPKDALCRESAFFVRNLQGDKKGAEECFRVLREVQIKAHKEANMDFLEIFSCWLHTGELVFEEVTQVERSDVHQNGVEEEREVKDRKMLDQSEEGLEKRGQGNVKPDFHLILPAITALYVFALNYEVPNLRKAVIRKLENDYPAGFENLPSTECLANAYKQMLPDYPPLIVLLVRYYVGYCNLDNENEMRDALDLPKGLLIEIAVELAQRAAWLKKRLALDEDEVEDGWFDSLDPCSVHEHESLTEEMACRDKRAQKYFSSRL